MARRGARRDRSKERFWRGLLRLWRRSSQTIRDFCAEHEVSEPSFFAWRRMIAERDQQRLRHDNPNSRAGANPLPKANEQPAFVPLRVVSTAADMAFDVVLKGGRVVRVPVGFEAASLRRLLAVLEEERPC